MLVNSCLPFEVSKQDNRDVGVVPADLLCEQCVLVDIEASRDDTKSSSCPRSEAAVRIHTYAPTFQSSFASVLNPESSASCAPIVNSNNKYTMAPMSKP